LFAPTANFYNSESVKKTKRLIVLDNAQAIGSFSSEIITQVCLKCSSDLVCNPIRIASKDIPFPTSSFLTKNIYADANSIIEEINRALGTKYPLIPRDDRVPHDVPGNWFTGPF